MIICMELSLRGRRFGHGTGRTLGICILGCTRRYDSDGFAFGSLYLKRARSVDINRLNCRHYLGLRCFVLIRMAHEEGSFYTIKLLKIYTKNIPKFETPVALFLLLTNATCTHIIQYISTSPLTLTYSPNSSLFTPPFPLPSSPFLITDLYIILLIRLVKRSSPLHLAIPAPPHILTALLAQPLAIFRVLLPQIMLFNRGFFFGAGVAPCSHAEPEIIPG